MALSRGEENSGDRLHTQGTGGEDLRASPGGGGVRDGPPAGPSETLDAAFPKQCWDHVYSWETPRGVWKILRTSQGCLRYCKLYVYGWSERGLICQILMQ